jgi:thiol:disulfide interchange protein
LRERIGLKGIPGALALGLVSGLVASQCATPVLAAILTYVMAKGAMLYGAALLFVMHWGAAYRWCWLEHSLVLSKVFVPWDAGPRSWKKPAA